ncbi:sigma factor-like helix-turn-helix DNA-binding protein [Nocardiopsis halotolerans]|uniref:sigma factor-like helix-turn-helix DNA-binding protein n=1 Tax=Nocardiopsis halotolerans TaxID=124252 RepID=UPI00034D4797|nr:sigma factor-like helix-turn-helix DNA-binding protein [Nocardiopsis halotolerans]
MARNVIRARRRRDGKRGEVLSPEGVPAVPEGTDTTRQVEERDTAIRALDRLSAADRELVMLLAWEGLELAEAARVLGCTAATARVRLHRARRRIERLLGSPAPEEEAGPPARARPTAAAEETTPTLVPLEEK